jgi:hypothetical protein
LALADAKLRVGEQLRALDDVGEVLPQRHRLVLQMGELLREEEQARENEPTASQC